jgi:hypothetical protein
MSLFDELFKGTRFERSYDNLSESARKTEDLANTVETGFENLLDLLEVAQSYVTDFIETLRSTAENLRAEAETKVGDVYDKVRPEDNDPMSDEERAEKLEFIRTRLASAGVTSGSKWLDPTYTSFVSDKMIKYTYRVFGGR